ncbi:hypothetical protein EDD29_2883 [Actinocorallia herbida]|uniref:DUF1963 domain-containing protein n=1 Tax=Actinocorallia herbida TaxID=58109 RepID=A0A3N1CVL8_9ACTN|nr:hypothetical protein [Actinocorallia herbida]ROO85340.1 hypothetical protein EDD29_2883 [Actinocorallia herbida]
MTRTTPPRPVDPAAAFPELAALARTATRLHPRTGAPTVHDSSVGGPLLWPADEPWPVCGDGHEVFGLTTVEDVRTRRRILTEAWARPRAPRANLLTPEEQAVIDRVQAGYEPSSLPAGPLPLLAVAQFYARDVPDLPCPEGTDLLQVLWCPFNEVMELSSAVRLRWRRSADVGEVLTRPPVPAFVGSDDYVPERCVLHPERVREYPPAHELDGELAKAVHSWAVDRGLSYRGDLSTAPGWKVGGWPHPWTFLDPPEPAELRCGACGGPVEALLTIEGREYDGESRSWFPLEDASAEPAPFITADSATMVEIGRGYTLQVYRCAATPDHPPLTFMQ